MNRLSNKHRKLRRAFRRSIRVCMARTTPEDAKALTDLMRKRVFTLGTGRTPEQWSPRMWNMPRYDKQSAFVQAFDRRYWDKIR